MHLITAWDALRFDTPLKWGITAGLREDFAVAPQVVIVLAIVFWCKTTLGGAKWWL